MINLFAFSYAGGSSYSLNSLKERFFGPVRFCPVDLPGRGKRMSESLLDSMEEIVDDLFSQIQSEMQSPYAFYGHSIGGCIAFLLAKKILIENFPPPQHLFISGSRHPSEKEKMKHNLGKDELKDILISMGGMPSNMKQNSFLFEIFEPILRADFKALEEFNYVNSSSIEVPISVLIGTADNITIESAMLWQQETYKPVNLYQFDGGHFFIFDHAQEIAEIVQKTLGYNDLVKISC